MAYVTSGNMCTTYEVSENTYYQGVKIESITDGSTLGVFAVRYPFTGSDFYDYTYRLFSVRKKGLPDSSAIGEYASGGGAREFTRTDSPVILNSTRYFYQGETTQYGDVSTTFGTFFSRRKDSILDLTIPVYDSSQLGSQDIWSYVNEGDDSKAKNYDDLHGAKCHFFVKNDGNVIQFNYNADIDEQHKAPTIDYYEVWALTGLGDMQKVSQSNSFSNITSINWSEFGLQHSARLYIRGIKNGEQKFELSCDCERKYLVLFGEVKTTIVVGEFNGHTLSLLDSGKGIEDISTSDYSISDSQRNRHSNDKFQALSNLVTCYRMGENQLASLGAWIYENDAFIEDIKLLFNNPMECLISLKYCPITIPVSKVTTVKLANIDTQIQGGVVSNTFYKRDIGSIAVPTFSNGFLNYEPYTSVSVFLPMAQKVILSPQDVIGYTIDVDLIVDVICGTFAYCVYTNKGGGSTLIHTVSGSCSIDIPLTQSNRAQIENGYISALINTISQPMNPVNAISNVIDSYTQQHHTNQFGGCSSMTGILQPNQCFIEVKYPVLSNPSKFAHTKGYMCMQDYTLESLNGFTKLANNIELKNLSFSKNGIDKLKTILTTGFYI